MTDHQDRARQQADELHKAIYEALRDGYNVSVTIHDQLPHFTGNSFFNDKRTTPAQVQSP